MSRLKYDLYLTMIILLACGYMASIPKLPPTIAILIAESARAIADTQRERAIERLNLITTEIFSQSIL